MDDERFPVTTRETGGATGRRAALVSFGVAAAALLAAPALEESVAARRGK